MAHTELAHHHEEVSVWPFVIGIGGLLVPISFTAYFAWGWQLPGLIMGGVALLLILFGVAGWANEHFTKDKELGLGAIGTILFIITETVIFGTMFASYYTARVAHADKWASWVPEGISIAMAGLLTLILWASSYTIWKAEEILENEGDTARTLKWVGITFVLGTLFVILHVTEWVHLWKGGFTLSSNMYGTAFYALTGLHTSHVIVGLLAHLYTMWLLSTGKLTRERPTVLRGVSAYWHFVDFMWLLVAGSVYIIGTMGV
ncbi:MAG: heme-copper oxidase subunit III [Aquificae bacterium]|nr:heme-copper oxidase subunit III [Aquificota bacterium]